uniref:Uncharacterized protein n=1 Tax=Timema douglasi TaxID=61478 RepID=A0A7R8VTG3_TIMDO|nr:unnamed protein product [Timema douglasi]
MRKLGTGSGQLAGSEKVDRLASKLGTGSGQLAGSERVYRLVSKLGTGSGQLAGSERVDRLASKLGTGSGQLAGSERSMTCRSLWSTSTTSPSTMISMILMTACSSTGISINTSISPGSIFAGIGITICVAGIGLVPPNRKSLRPTTRQDCLRRLLGGAPCGNTSHHLLLSRHAIQDNIHNSSCSPGVGVAPSSNRGVAVGDGPMPAVGRGVQVHYIVAVHLLLRVERPVQVTPTAKHVHTSPHCCGRVKVAVRGRSTLKSAVSCQSAPKKPRGYCKVSKSSMYLSVDIAPVECQQIQHVHLLGEAIDVLHEPSEDVHAVVNDAGRMAVPRARNLATHLRYAPLQGYCNEFIP